MVSQQQQQQQQKLADTWELILSLCGFNSLLPEAAAHNFQPTARKQAARSHRHSLFLRNWTAFCLISPLVQFIKTSSIHCLDAWLSDSLRYKNSSLNIFSLSASYNEPCGHNFFWIFLLIAYFIPRLFAAGLKFEVLSWNWESLVLYLLLLLHRLKVLPHIQMEIWCKMCGVYAKKRCQIWSSISDQTLSPHRHGADEADKLSSIWINSNYGCFYSRLIVPQETFNWLWNRLILLLMIHHKYPHKYTRPSRRSVIIISYNFCLSLGWIIYIIKLFL